MQSRRMRLAEGKGAYVWRERKEVVGASSEKREETKMWSDARGTDFVKEQREISAQRSSKSTLLAVYSEQSERGYAGNFAADGRPPRAECAPKICKNQKRSSAGNNERSNGRKAKKECCNHTGEYAVSLTQGGSHKEPAAVREAGTQTENVWRRRWGLRARTLFDDHSAPGRVGAGIGSERGRD